MMARLTPQRETNFQPWRWPGRSFSSHFWPPKKSKKNSHFLKTHDFQLFQASKPFPSSSPCPKHTLQCPNQSLGPSRSFVLSDFRPPKKSKKISHFLKTHNFQLFQASKPLPSSSPCPNDTLQCPNQSPGPSGSFVLSDFFLQQKNHF